MEFDRKERTRYKGWITGRSIALASVVLIGLIILVVTVFMNQHPYWPSLAKVRQATHPPPTPFYSPPASIAPSTSTSAAPSSSLNLQNLGSLRTQEFSAGADWQLDWSYDCTKIGRLSHFNIIAYTANGRALPDTISKLGVKDAGSQHYHEPGTFYLTVVTDCSWKIATKG